jgi:hypothetical protein
LRTSRAGTNPCLPANLSPNPLSTVLPIGVVDRQVGLRESPATFPVTFGAWHAAWARGGVHFMPTPPTS